VDLIGGDGGGGMVDTKKGCMTQKCRKKGDKDKRKERQANTSWMVGELME